jgi:hypothetical protein
MKYRRATSSPAPEPTTKPSISTHQSFTISRHHSETMAEATSLKLMSW